MTSSVSFTDHMEYKNYTAELTKITSGIDEIMYLFENLDTDKIDLLLKDIAENYDYVPPFDEDDVNSSESAYSSVENTSVVVDEITDEDKTDGDYVIMTTFITDNFTTIKRKCINLKDLADSFKNEYITTGTTNTLIKEDYEKQKPIYKGKIEKLIKLLDEIKKEVFKEKVRERVKFNIQLVAKNDIRCIIGYTKFKIFFKNLHVADKEESELTKEDTNKFKEDLYDIYKGLCARFNIYLKQVETSPIINKLNEIKGHLDIT